jgi:hypothetical protein
MSISTSYDSQLTRCSHAGYSNLVYDLHAGITCFADSPLHESATNIILA